MSILEVLQAGDNLFAIVGTILTAVFFLWRWRIQSRYHDLAFTWTNEGSINGSETTYIDLALQYVHGELFGTLTSPQFKESYEVHVQPGWVFSTAKLSLLRGRNVIPITQVKLFLKGNKNRLHWKLKDAKAPGHLPRTTELWPSPSQEKVMT